MVETKVTKIIDKIWKDQNKFLEQFDTIKVPRGGLDKYGAEALEFLIKKVKKKGIKVLEIGSWTGCSSIILGNLVKKLKGQLTCVDAFQGSEDSNLTCADYVNIENIFLENIKQAKLKKTIHIIIENSKDIMTEFEDYYFDMIFIDADHRYGHVLKDIKLCLPKLKKRGILCGHDCEYLIKGYKDLFKQTEKIDYTQCHTGVIRAVYEMFGNKAKVTKKGYMWYVKK